VRTVYGSLGPVTRRVCERTILVMRRSRFEVPVRTVVVFVAVMLTACCGAGASPTKVLGGTTPAVSTSTPSTSGSPGGPFILGLGDSVPGAGGPCQRDPNCRSYVLVLADLASAALGHTVVAVNRASNDNVTSAGLLRELQANPTTRDLVAKASMVVLQVGNNDWQGPCHFAGAAKCLESNRGHVKANLGRILDEVVGLRGGSPRGIRVVTYANTLLEDSPAEAWGYADTSANEQAMVKIYSQALRKLDATICSVARTRSVTCVDLLPAINGPDGTRPSSIGGIHPTRVGHELIAQTVAAAGFNDVS
jgi:lysophospholipase L1-like esterase